MGRQIGKLKALQAERLTKKPGMYGDGGGLWLCVSSRNAASWLFRYRLNGRSREMGLGPFADVTLAEARERAAAGRRVKAAGKDPIAERDAQVAHERAEAARAITFRQCAQSYIAAHQSAWKSAKHAAQWSATLRDYAFPLIADVPVQSVDVAMVHKILESIWSSKPETAGRVRGRIEAILDWATARGYRTGENPGRWKGHLENLFPSRAKLKPVKHHSALRYRDIADFMALLRAQSGTAALVLQFVILTAARTGEALGATWDEIDFDASIWSIPAARMKAGREHRVPLSDQATAILRKLPRTGKFLFAGSKTNSPLSNMAMLQTLRRMNRSELTVHGFRSTFRDWAAEQTNYPKEVAETALAHTTGDKVEAAYRRGDLFDKRRKLMAAWANYSWAKASAANVVSMHKTAA